MKKPPAPEGYVPAGSVEPGQSVLVFHQNLWRVMKVVKPSAKKPSHWWVEVCEDDPLFDTRTGMIVKSATLLYTKK